MSVLVVGISHKTAPVSVLERVALDSEGAHKLIREVTDIEHVTEATVLSTCNRTEVYADVDRFHGSVEAISRMLGDRAGQSPEDVLSPPLRALRRRRRLAPVPRRRRPRLDGARREPDPRPDPRGAADGPGGTARVGPALNVLFQQALRVGKRSHAETDIDRVAPSLVATALDRAADHVGDLAGKHVVVVGAGVDGRPDGRRPPSRAGAASIVVANRTPERATRLAEQYDATAIPLTDLGERHRPGRRARLVHRRGRRPRSTPTRSPPAVATTAPLAVVDLALPRDVDPEVADLPGVRLIALDTLAAELEDAPGGADVEGVRTIVGPGARRLPRRPPQPERDPDRGRAAHDGDRRGRGRARPADRAGCPTSTTSARAEVEKTPSAASPRSCSTSRPCASRSWPTTPEPSPTPPRSPSCSRSTPRPSRP